MDELKYEVYKNIALKSIGAFCGTAATLLIEKGLPAVISAIAKKVKKEETDDETIIDSEAVVVETEES